VPVGGRFVLFRPAFHHPFYTRSSGRRFIILNKIIISAVGFNSDEVCATCNTDDAEQWLTVDGKVYCWDCAWQCDDCGKRIVGWDECNLVDIHTDKHVCNTCFSDYDESDLIVPRTVEAEVESNVELDSVLFVTWDCFDTLPYLVSLDGIRVNLNYRPAFCPEEGMYRSVGDGDEDSFMVEWTGTAERCDWRNPSRIVTLDEYNAENVGNAHLHVPAEVLDGYVQEADVVPVEWIEEVFPGNDAKTDLLGNPIHGSVVPSRQLSLFDKTDFTRTSRCFLAVILRENGEQAFGKIDSRTPKKELTFTAHASGSTFRIPIQYCKISWAGNSAIIDIAERDLGKNCNWYGMFKSCRLF